MGLLFLIAVAGFTIFMYRRGGCCKGANHNHHHSGGYNIKPERQNKEIELVIDPQCESYVNPSNSIKQRIGEKTYYFCSETCRKNYLKRLTGSEVKGGKYREF